MELNGLLDVLKKFPDEASCIKHLEKLRWGDSVISPFDKTSKVYKCSNGSYKCKNSNRYFNVKIGTIFQDSKIPLRTWYMVIYLVTKHKRGISSYQLAEYINVTQKTAWFVLHRLRITYQNTGSYMLSNVVEADETYVGGKERNRHYDKKFLRRGKKTTGRGSFQDKKPVVGVVERGGEVRAIYVPNSRKEHIEPFLFNNIKQGSQLMTDEYYGYNRMGNYYEHSTIKHIEKKYVDGVIHTNTIENFWSVLKRGLYGVYVNVSRKHFQTYVDEYTFKYNSRDLDAMTVFTTTLSNAVSLRMTYKGLIDKEEPYKPEPEPVLEEFEIWASGFTGYIEIEKASFISRIKARNFQEACDKVLKRNKQYNSGNLTLWGVRLYDNEEDARKAFG